MQSRDRALRGTAAAYQLWGGVYMMLAFVLLTRALHVWNQMKGQPVGQHELFEIGLELVFYPAPLLLGNAFRKLMRGELRKSVINQRTYKICNYWIAKVLIIAYIAMVL
ncbi:MAG TPA: hypothetical protein VMQ56_12690 [Terracidiphilus sp.]|jgi:hypothetical protein|nr:hypothetical protein [Terracidiphilus sp.]